MRKITLLIFCFIFISCFKEPKKDNPNSTDYTEPTIDSKKTGIENGIKKYAYVTVKISKPILKGTKSKFYDIENVCYVDYEDEYFNTEVLELDSYNEDVKYKLLDKIEKDVLSKYKYNSLYQDAVVEYGYEAAEDIKKDKYSIKIVESNVYVFNSYAEASKNLRDLK